MRNTNGRIRPDNLMAEPRNINFSFRRVFFTLTQGTPVEALIPASLTLLVFATGSYSGLRPFSLRDVGLIFFMLGTSVFSAVICVLCGWTLKPYRGSTNMTIVVAKFQVILAIFASSCKPESDVPALLYQAMIVSFILVSSIVGALAALRKYVPVDNLEVVNTGINRARN